MPKPESCSLNHIAANQIEVVLRQEVHHLAERRSVTRHGCYWSPDHESNPYPGWHTTEIEHKMLQTQYWQHHLLNMMGEVQAKTYSKKDQVLAEKYIERLRKLVFTLLKNPNFGQDLLTVVCHHENIHVLQQLKWQTATLLTKELKELPNHPSVSPAERRELWFLRVMLAAEMEVQAFAEQARHLKPGNVAGELLIWASLRRAVCLLGSTLDKRHQYLQLLIDDLSAGISADQHIVYRLAATKLLTKEKQFLSNLVVTDMTQLKAQLSQGVKAWLDTPQSALAELHSDQFARMQNDHLAELCEATRERMAAIQGHLVSQ